MQVIVKRSPWSGVDVGDVYEVVALSNSHGQVYTWNEANRVTIKQRCGSFLYPEKTYFDPIFPDVYKNDLVCFKDNSIASVDYVQMDKDESEVVGVHVFLKNGVFAYWDQGDFRVLEKKNQTTSVTHRTDMKSRLSQRLDSDYLTAKKEKQIVDKAKAIRAKIDELETEINSYDEKLRAAQRKQNVLSKTFDAIEEEFESPDPETMEKLLALDIDSLNGNEEEE